jgi:hypothetical protein
MARLPIVQTATASIGGSSFSPRAAMFSMPSGKQFRQSANSAGTSRRQVRPANGSGAGSGGNALSSGFDGYSTLVTSCVNDRRFSSDLKSERARAASARAAGEESPISK